MASLDHIDTTMTARAACNGYEIIKGADVDAFGPPIRSSFPRLMSI
jgi:hypothetical protein